MCDEVKGLEKVIWLTRKFLCHQIKLNFHLQLWIGAPLSVGNVIVVKVVFVVEFILYEVSYFEELCISGCVPT